MTDTEHFDSLAETYSTQADYCRHMAEEPGGAFDEPWVLLAVAMRARQSRRRSSPTVFSKPNWRNNAAVSTGYAQGKLMPPEEAI